MAGMMSTEVLQEAEVAVRLKRKRINEKILPELKEELKKMFPGAKVAVGLGRDEAIKLRHWGEAEEKKVRRLIWTIGGKISRR